MAKKAKKAAAPKRAAKRATKTAAKSEAAKNKRLKEQAVRTLSGKPDPVLQHSADDLRQKRGIEGVPPAGRSKVVEVIYTPPDDHPDMTSVDGIPFRAFEPVAIPVDRQNTIQTLTQNPHFTVGKVDKKSQNYKVWQLREKHTHDRQMLQERHNKEMVALRGAGYSTTGDLLPVGGMNPNPPRTS